MRFAIIALSFLSTLILATPTPQVAPVAAPAASVPSTKTEIDCDNDYSACIAAAQLASGSVVSNMCVAIFGNCQTTAIDAPTDVANRTLTAV